MIDNFMHKKWNHPCTLFPQGTSNKTNKANLYARYLIMLLVVYFGNGMDGACLANYFDILDPASAISSKLNDLEGDYRPLKSHIDFSQGGSTPYHWEIFTAGTWLPTSVPPQVAKPSRIIINKKDIGAGASSANTYNDIVVIAGGELIIDDDEAAPTKNFLNPSRVLEVQSGGKLLIEGDIKMINSTFLIIRNGGSMVIDQSSVSNIHPMWDGVEVFEEGSTVIIKSWNWNAPFNQATLIDNANTISSNAGGYKFGSLHLDVNPTSAWTLISGADGIINLCENDLYINNSSTHFITGASNETGVNGFLVNGNMIVSKGSFAFGSSFTTGTFNHQFVINGSFDCASNHLLKLHHSVAFTPATLDGLITFKNNVTIASSVSLFTSDLASDPERNMSLAFNGGTPADPLFLDVAPTAITVSMVVMSGSYVQLKGHDLNTNSKPGSKDSIIVQSEATLNFGWAPDGVTPLVIKRSGANAGSNKFISEPGSILKITSENGLQDALTTGNVQYSASNKKYNTSGTFWFIGKTNQVTGDCFGTSGTGRQVIIEMANNELSVTLTQSFSLTDKNNVSPTGGKLDIRRGKFLETETAFITGVINENKSGTLYMSPGTLYRISSLSSSDVQPKIPRMSGVSFPYQLDGGTIELSAAGEQMLRGNKAYRNLTFSNSGIKTLASAPTSVTGTILIKDDVVLDVGVNSLGGENTNFTMEGRSRYITAGVLTKPDAQGAYHLGTETTIEFSNSDNLTMQDIRLGLSIGNPVAYNHIVISGNNVGNSSLMSTPITMQAGSVFTVTSTGNFRHKNANGFSGASNTCITNVPTVVLAEGSTISYNRDNGTNQNISIQQPYKNLVLSGSGTKTAPAGIFSIHGNLDKTGTALFKHADGTVVLEGSLTQTITCNSEMVFHNLVNKNEVGVMINSNIAVERELLLGSASKITLNTSDIILKSGIFSTASVAKIPANATINYNIGRFVAERYINTGLPANGQHLKSWQLVSTPAFGETIMSTWQENKMNLATFGTWITSNLPNWAALGFDAYSAAPSMKTYDAVTNQWIGIPNTNINLEDAKGYMIFIRGDRTVTSIGQDGKPCILRTRGKLYAPFPGYNPPQISIMPDSYGCIGNPYASRIDLEYMMDKGLMNGLDGVFYVWDPLRYGAYGVGGYQTISKSLGYKPVPGIPGNPTNYYDPAIKSNFIESGQAFFVRNSSGVNRTITFTEDCKASGSRLVNKEAGNVNYGTLRTYLFTEDDNLADGNAVVFENKFSDVLDSDDAMKMLNATENFGLFRENKILAVEARKPVADRDTLFFDMQNLKLSSYKLAFDFENMQRDVDAVLIDQFLQTRSSINMEGRSVHAFSITRDPGSSQKDRFMILLNKRVALPVVFKSLTAFHQNKSVILNWLVENEMNVASYSIEKSEDLIRFISVDSLSLRHSYSSGYKWTDNNPTHGYNYYRIKSVSINGEIKFSDIVTINVKENAPSIAVFPNPVRENAVQLHLKNQPGGTYRMRVFNSFGSLVVSREIRHIGNDRRERIYLPKYSAQGIYWLEINNPENEKTVIRIKLE